MNLPDAGTILASAVVNLRSRGEQAAADLLSRCTLEIGSVQQYSGTTVVGLNLTLRCDAADIGRFEVAGGVFAEPSQESNLIKVALGQVLPAEYSVHECAARSRLVGKAEYDKSEIERLIEAQRDLMISVATGGPRIESKNAEYRQRREMIRERLTQTGRTDPNPFDDLWAWYGRWSSGDLPSYKSRREYVRQLYQPLLQALAGTAETSAEPVSEPTGWTKVDRTVDAVISQLSRSTHTEDFQAVGLLCRECLISLAQAVYDPSKHIPLDGTDPSSTDAFRMLEAYFGAEYAGSANEALRGHAKAALKLANALQHERTADERIAALCAEATRTVVNIVAITSKKRPVRRHEHGAAGN